MLSGFSQLLAFEPSISINQNIQKAILLIGQLQMLALIYPEDGWNFWSYTDNGLRIQKNLLNITLIFPYLHQIQSTTLIKTLVLLLLGFNIFILSIICFLVKFKNNCKLLTNLCFWYLIFLQKNLNLPQLYILLGVLTFNKNGLLYRTFSFDTYIPLSIICLIITQILNISGFYFLRNRYLFQQFGLQQKFTAIGLVTIFLQIIIVCIQFQQKSQFLNIILNLIMHLYYISSYIDSLYNYIYPPYLNKFNAILISSCQSCLIIVSINLFSEGNSFGEIDILHIQLIFAILSASITNQFFERKQTKLLLLGQLKSDQQHIIQQIYYLMPGTIQGRNAQKKNSKIQFFMLLKSHTNSCSNCETLLFNNKNALKLQFIEIFSCMLLQQKRYMKSNFSQDIEQLEIYHLELLAKVKKQPLLALVELKIFLLNYQERTLYFQQIFGILQKEFQEMIRSGKTQKTTIQQFEECNLEIEEMIQASFLEEKFMPQIAYLIDRKLDIWNRQIEGIDTILQLQYMIVRYSNQLVQCQNQLLEELNFNFMSQSQIQKSKNVIELRIASIFHLAILNDFYSSLLCESQISEIISIENSLPNDIISNIDLLDDSLCLIMVSMVKNRGQIKNKKSHLIANFFGYDNKEIESINNINIFLPSFVLEIHDKFLLNYLETAESHLFQKYSIVFSKQKNDFIQACQLKLANDFNFIDDYVVVGCISKIKQSSEFILFDESGKILSLSQGFVQNIQYPAFLETLSITQLNQAYIFLFFPNIFQILQQQKDNINNSETSSVEIMSSLVIIENLSKMITYFNDLKVQGTQSNHYLSSQQFTSNQTSSVGFRKKKKEPNKLGKHYISNSVKLSDDFLLLCQTYKERILNKLSLFQKQQSVQYLAKYNLTFKTIGQKKFQKSYFILEIFDFRKKDYPYTSSLASRQQDSVFNNQNFSSVVTDIATSERVVQKDEQKPYVQLKNFQEIIGNSFNHLLSDREQLFGILNQSAHESQSFGPLSQRAHFISPRQLYLEDESRKLEQEFQDVRKSFNTGFQEQQNENEEDYENEKESKKLESSSTEKKKQVSNKLQKVITAFKDQFYKIDERQSLSSNTSGTSKTQYITFVKHFQHSKVMIKSLRIISGITFFLFLSMVASTITNTQIIQQQNQKTISNSYSLNAPLLFNRYFFQSYSLSWTLLMNALQIVEYSDFSNNQTFSTLKSMEDEVFSNLSQMYSNFIEIENMGLLSNISLMLLGLERQTVSYTVFINTIQNSLQYFFQIKYFSHEARDQILDIEYINSVVTLRYNLRYVFQMNKELIFSLDILGQELIKTCIENVKIITIVEICIIFMLHLIQIFFWISVQSQKQQIIQINGRIQEENANEMIIRHLHFKSLLFYKDKSQNNWKKQPYSHLYQTPLNKLQFGELQSKIDQTLNKTKYDQKKKKGQNGILNSRLKNTSFSIMRYLIFYLLVFLFLASFLLCGFIYYSRQIVDLIPQQQLTLNFLRFSSYLDTLITGALVIKSQKLVYKNLVSQNFYTQTQLDSYRDPLKQLFHMFLDVYEVYDQNITSIYEDILFSTLFNEDNQQLLLSIYQNDLCQPLSDKIPFCQFRELGKERFINLYSDYRNQDNNLDYLQNGIVGIISDINKFMKSNFDYEIEAIQYSEELQVIKQLLVSQEFQNIIIQHFSSTAKSTEIFLKTILNTNEEVITQQNSDITLYFVLVGLALFLLFIFVFYYLIDQENKNIIYLRLGLTLIPLEIVTDQYTIQLIKKLI